MVLSLHRGCIKKKKINFLPKPHFQAPCSRIRIFIKIYILPRRDIADS